MLFIPLICCLYFFRRGILVIVFMICVTSQAHAGAFTNRNQDGEKLFSEGNYTAAAQSFVIPRWKAAAFYRNQNYAEALKFFSQNNEIDDLYNQGNALAKGGKIEEAIAKYEEVLKQNPNHEDAKFNLEYLKQQQNNQNQSQQNSKDNNSQDNQDQESSDKSSQDNNEENSSTDDNQKQNEGGNNSDLQASASSNAAGNENKDDTAPQSGENDQNPANYSAKDVPSGSEPDQPSNETAEFEAGQSKDDSGEFNEEIQAREMSYRNIPEDPGGLLRAFIRKEYNKNRYGDK